MTSRFVHLCVSGYPFLKREHEGWLAIALSDGWRIAGVSYVGNVSDWHESGESALFVLTHPNDCVELPEGLRL